ncbi:hypothetical protein [Haploplasma axanthum]|uniref:Uncharacterized protein n=1 Tax=Haploplasma axanthum TaxID=29552 RepID=A0A449BF32_HAPAX|nr:hypothetical protein [Haploplasma axanthum]VEU81057.1 Uncharacterised protein [Haploplasma axanthum]
MKKIIKNILVFAIINCLFWGFTAVSAVEIDNNIAPNLNDATLLSEKVEYFNVSRNEINSMQKSDYSTENAHTLDFSSNDVTDYQSFFVSITTHLYRNYIAGKGEKYYIQMTISMNNLDLNNPQMPNSIGMLEKAETAVGLNGKLFYSEDFYASLFADQNMLILKNRQWVDITYDYDEYTYDYTKRTGWFLKYNYEHFYRRNRVMSDFSETNRDSFVFRGGNSVLYNFNFSNLKRGASNLRSTQYNRTVVDNITIYNSIGIAFTSEIDFNFDDIKYVNVSGQFAMVTHKINWGAISVSFPAGISINPSELIKKEVTYYRSKQDLQWKVI